MRSKYEIEAQKELESQGWRVDYKARPTYVPRNYSVDFLGVFDLIAYRAGDPLRFISIKGKEGIKSSHRADVENMIFSLGVQKEIWQYNPKRKRERVKKVIIE